MILSVSRRTDIPAFHSEWFAKRMREGFVITRNPMNPKQVSRISLAPENIDAIVFWSKNPSPLLKFENTFKHIPHYYQFTLTDYDNDMEPVFFAKRNELIETFKKLSDKNGPERVVWRYDPIILTSKYSIATHLDMFSKIAEKLKGYGEQCVISFADKYDHLENDFNRLGVAPFTDKDICELAENMSQIASRNGFTLATCAEHVDLSKFGIVKSRCVDPDLIEKICGYSLTGKGKAKDKVQREECGCASSVDIGAYDTCPGGCVYCYACRSKKTTEKKLKVKNNNSPLLCDELTDKDVVTERKVSSLKNLKDTLSQDKFESLRLFNDYN